MKILSLLFLFFLPAIAQAQTPTVTYDFTTDAIHWEWTKGDPPMDVDAEGFVMYCGKSSGQYSLITPIYDPAAREMAIKDAVTGSGDWYCACTAFAGSLQSDYSNEVFFYARGGLSAPYNLSLVKK